MKTTLRLAIGIVLSGTLSCCTKPPAEQEVTNKPFYFDVGDSRFSNISPLARNLNSDSVSSTTATAVTTQLTDTEEPDTEPVKPTYQCLYHANTYAYCQELEKCQVNRTEIVLTDNRTFSGYDCKVPVVQIQHTIKSGIASIGFRTAMTTAPQSADLLFVCHFYADKAPSRQSFACATPIDCRFRGALSPCSGGTPWFGVWTGDLKLGLWGVVTNAAVESA